MEIILNKKMNKSNLYSFLDNFHTHTPCAPHSHSAHDAYEEICVSVKWRLCLEYHFRLWCAHTEGGWRLYVLRQIVLIKWMSTKTVYWCRQLMIWAMNWFQARHLVSASCILHAGFVKMPDRFTSGDEFFLLNSITERCWWFLSEYGD